MKLPPFLAAALTAFVFYATPTQAAPAQANLAPAYGNAITTFMKANAGDKNATDAAVQAFDALVSASTEAPEIPLYQAYLGAAQTMQGRDAWMPWSKVKATERGLDTLDKALRRLAAAHEQLLVRGVPIALEAKLVAANTFVSVPDMIFHRRDRGQALLQEIQKHPQYAGTPADFRAQVEQAVAKAAAK